MHCHFRNVNDAFQYFVNGIAIGDIPTHKTESRAGTVLQITEPVTITYARPTERVLFNESRDCNPFFHLYESIWMLAGCEDVASVAYYNPRMREFSDDGLYFHGAYGHRWRWNFGYDQLEWIIEELQHNPNSRRCVLAMWDACNCHSDIGVLGTDPEKAIDGGLDVPCNTHAYFMINSGSLDMTVCNRSNDLVWGCFGANVVHFSYLLEYMANCIGCNVGRYHQVTNNLHVYTECWEPTKWCTAPFIDYAPPSPLPLVHNRKVFDDECRQFIADKSCRLTEPYLAQVVAPMCLAFHHHKNRDYQLALEAMQYVRDPQWQTAGLAWLRRREVKWRIRNEETSTDQTGLRAEV